MGFLVAVFAGQSLGATGVEDPAEFFEKRVRPVLAAKCFDCHSASSKKLKANLHLDSRAGVLQGGDSGPAIMPGDPAASRLIEAISYKNLDLQMPPKARLSDAVIADLTAWVKMGAPWPGEQSEMATKPRAGNGFDIEARKAEHWCWQPVKVAAPPAVRDGAWARDDLDRFILAELERQQLRLAPEADRRTLLRRLYLDLTGLPPTPEQGAAFVADSSAEALPRLVDALLASPHFGERWGRHWLDLVRYAETYGHEFDYPIPEAWRYRDYIIRALSADVPYDRLVTEHIAGDLLPDPRMHPDGTDESVLATGMWFMHEQTHAPVDARLHQADRIDNQIDVLTKTFLGLTVACARCHDHKFDAISTRDYYALYGYFVSSRKQQAPRDIAGRIGAGAAEVQRLHRIADGLLNGAAVQPTLATDAKVDARADANAGEPGAVFETFDAPGFKGWFTSGWAFGDGPTRTGEWDIAGEHPRRMPAGVAHSGRIGGAMRGTLRSATFTVTHKRAHFRVAGRGRVRVVVNGYTLDEVSGLLFRGLIQEVESPGEFRWVSVAGDLAKYVGHRAYIELIDDGEGALLVDEIRFGDGPPPTVARQKTVEDTPAIRDDVREQVETIRRRIEAVTAAMPEPAAALAMADGNGVDEHVFIRGSHRNLGPRVPRRFLEALGGNDEPAPAHTSGRLQLAKQIVDPKNPLTPRVIVNRIWHHLIGRGIVASVDNFGVLGQPPSHPELLDHLAHRFVEGGWSIKRMIRAIVLSSTYRMASRGDAAAEAADPQNLLLHRMNVKRMEGEVIRDALLAVSGRLDRALHGPSVPIHLTAFMEGRGRPKTSGPLDGDGRRSIYVEVRRNFLSPMMLAFDTPQPFQTVGRRTISNVPAQALILMNDPLVIQQAQLWARRALDMPARSVPQRIAWLYETAFARPPTGIEMREAMAFLEARWTGPASADTQRVWTDLCHVLMNVKEFVFVY